MIESAFQKLMVTLDQLERAGIRYSLRRIREDAIMIEVAAPGERWEIEILGDASIEVEVFRSDGRIFDEGKINDLMDCFADRIPPVQINAGAAESSDRT
jgi:hypothetical protein